MYTLNTSSPLQSPILTMTYLSHLGRRRPSMIRGGLVISSTILTIGTLYARGASSTPGGRWAIGVLIYLFTIVFATSWAVVNRIYCSEIQLMYTRATATLLGQCANWASPVQYSLLRDIEPETDELTWVLS